jgi:hypothetical protein
VKRSGLIVYSESRTFGAARQARDWGERLSKQLARPGAIEARAAARAKPDGPTEHSPLSVAGLIKRYIDYVDPIQPLRRSGCSSRSPQARRAARPRGHLAARGS